MPLTNTITYMPMTYSFTLLMKISKVDDPKLLVIKSKISYRSQNIFDKLYKRPQAILVIISHSNFISMQKGPFPSVTCQT